MSTELKLEGQIASIRNMVLLYERTSSLTRWSKLLLYWQGRYFSKLHFSVLPAHLLADGTMQCEFHAKMFG